MEQYIIIKKCNYDIDKIVGCFSCHIIFNNVINDNIKKQINKYGIKNYI